MQLSDLTTSGLLAQGAGAAVAILRTRAQEWDLPLHEEDGILSLQIWEGELRLIPAPPGARLTIRAPERRLVQVIRDAISEVLAAEGIAVAWERVETGALAPGLSLMRVVAVSNPVPGFLRLRVEGPEAARFATGGLHFRLLLPRPGQVAVWPRIAASGRTEWPEGEAALYRPVFTVAAQAEDWLEFDVFRHAGSPTCDWAESAPLGQEVGLMGPGGGWLPEAPHLRLFGDQTALPAMRRILALARGEIRAFLRADPADLAELSQDPRVEIVSDLLAALRACPLPEAGFVWFAGPEAEARQARADLTARGVSKRSFSAVAYWS